MEDPMRHFERMGRELKCPICLSLLNSAASLPCNHVFCKLCIVKSMKSASVCPVCKVPFTRREVRPAPHMDNLVAIYKNMEVASGISLFVTQNVPATNLSDEEVQCEGDADGGKEDAGGAHQNHAQKRKPLIRKESRKNAKTSTQCTGPETSKPSFPAKKRVQVPQNPLSETSLKNSAFGDSLTGVNKEGKESDLIVTNERPPRSKNNEPVYSPFFWLREVEEGEKSTQQSDGDEFTDDTPTPIPPSFSDLKDSDDENPSKETSTDEVQNKVPVDLFDSEMFEWTQMPCSPELFLSPVKMQSQALNTGEINENQEGLTAFSEELEIDPSRVDANNTKFQSPREGNRLIDVLLPSETSKFNSAADINGTKKSTKRGRKTRGELKEKQNLEQRGQIDGMDIDSNISSVVAKDQSRNEQQKSSNMGKTNRRGKRVCFNTSTNVTPRPSCTISNISEIIGNSEMNMEKNSNTLPCIQEKTEKDAPQEITEKCQRKRSRKKKLENLQDLAEELSDRQNQTSKFAGSASSTLSLQTDNKGKNSKQTKWKSSTKSISCNGESRSAKKLKLSSDCISKTKTGKDIQPNESIQRGADAKALNDKSKEKHCPSKDEPVLQKCEIHAKKYECAFCLSSEESEASGPLIHYYGDKPVSADYKGGSKVTHSHRNCTEWAPNVYFEDENAVNLEAEISRSRRIKCSFCGLKGAALGCYEKSCRRSFHVPCAKWSPQCRWDMENFVMLCPLHCSSELPCESSGSQQSSKKCTFRKGKIIACKPTDQSHAAHGSFKKIVLCGSALSVQERDVVSEFERLSKVTVLKKWDSTVTHVIASTDENGACKRTLKVLLGILEGKWILNIEWIKACIKEMEPVDEEHYEITVDIHGISDGPRLGRLRVLNKQPKLFDGHKFYFMGDFALSYKGYLQDLVTAAGGMILNRKPVSSGQKAMSADMHHCQTLIVYSLELPDKCSPLKRDNILNQRRHDAEVLASSTGSMIASNTWILDSIAACKLQSLGQ